MPHTNPHDDDQLDNPRYCFTLTLSATELTDEIANAIYGLDIDDALVCEANGSVCIDFDVEDTCIADAIVNAIEKVEAALPGLLVIAVHPPGETAIEEANAFLRTRRSDAFAKWGKLLSKK